MKSLSQVVIVLCAFFSASEAFANGEEPVRTGYMFQGVFDSKNDRKCRTGQFHCINGSFPMDEAIARVCYIRHPSVSIGWQTFGMDLNSFHEFASRIFECRPDAVLRISFEHGPARPPRPWRGYWTWERTLSVASFNRNMIKNRAFQRRYADYLKQLKAETVDRYPGKKFIFFGIEDNWSCDAFTAIAGIFARVFGSSAELMRNPVSLSEQCEFANGFRRELHGPMTEGTLRQLRRGDIYCPDGAFHAIPGDSERAMNPASNRPDVSGWSEALRVARIMRQRGIWFEEWYPELQAKTREEHSHNSPPHKMEIPMQFVPWLYDQQMIDAHQGR